MFYKTNFFSHHLNFKDSKPSSKWGFSDDVHFIGQVIAFAALYWKDSHTDRFLE